VAGSGPRDRGNLVNHSVSDKIGLPIRHLPRRRPGLASEYRADLIQMPHNCATLPKP
jgi:hypothetical protein